MQRKRHVVSSKGGAGCYDTPEPESKPLSDGRTAAVARLRLVSVEQTAPFASGERIQGAADALQAVKRYFLGKDREHVLVLHLDSAHRVLSSEVVSIGGLNSAFIRPRDIFKAAILANAAAIICAHNHPSGDLVPSDEDRRVYDALKEAGELLGTTLLDFLIIAGESHWAASDVWA